MNNQTVKPELKNPEMKAAYITSHWGQKIMFWTMNGHSDLHKISASGMPKQSISQKSILLTPFDQISDEDAAELAKIALFSPNIEDWNPDEVWIGEGDMDNRGNHTLEVGMRCWTGLLKINDESGSITLHDEDGEMQEIYNLSAIVDQIRSRGIAFPWMNWSVKELIEAGYCQLKGGCDE